MKNLKRLVNKQGIISALAIDQRGSLKNMLEIEGEAEQSISEFKKLISEKLTPFSSSILLDPEYGIDASKKKDSNCGLIFSYEKTGYDKQELGRYPDLIEEFSVKRLKELNADAIKLLIYVDVDEDDKINRRKEAFVERVGNECLSESLPFFLEIITYDDTIGNEKGKEFAKVKPYKVIKAMEKYSNCRFNVDVLKVEVPVNMNYVEGFTDNDFIYTKEEARFFFKKQSEVSKVPFIFLSAGVTTQLFKETLLFASESGSKFNGVLCGRATWSGATEAYNVSKENAVKWLDTNGIDNIKGLDELVNNVATPIK